MSKAEVVRAIATEHLAPIVTEHLANASEIIAASIAKQNWPPLRLKSGLTIYHDTNDPVEALFAEIFASSAYIDRNFYSPGENDVIVDCGAHIGIFALYLLSQQPKLTVHCFEPNPVPYKTLETNISRNGLQNQIKAYPIAIMDSRQHRLLQTYALSTASGTLFQPAHDWPSRAESVQCISLQEAFEYARIVRTDLLKIDVEGAEIEILEGAHRTGILESIPRIAVDIHEFIRPGSREICGSLLRSSGFTVHQQETPSPFGFMHETFFGDRAN